MSQERTDIVAALRALVPAGYGDDAGISTRAGLLRQAAAVIERRTPKRMRHKKRGTEYEVLGEANLQTGKPLSDYAVVVVYRDPSTGRLWVRPREEFYDGRFEEVPADGQ